MATRRPEVSSLALLVALWMISGVGAAELASLLVPEGHPLMGSVPADLGAGVEDLQLLSFSSPSDLVTRWPAVLDRRPMLSNHAELPPGGLRRQAADALESFPGCQVVGWLAPRGTAPRLSAHDFRVGPGRAHLLVGVEEQAQGEVRHLFALWVVSRLEPVLVADFRRAWQARGERRRFHVGTGWGPGAWTDLVPAGSLRRRKGPPGGGVPVRVTLLARGQSGEAKPGREALRSRSALRRAWRRLHEGLVPRPPPPAFDPRSQLALVVHRGQGPGGGVRVAAARWLPDGSVRVEVDEPGAGGDRGRGSGSSRPYTLVRLEVPADTRISLLRR